jgi:nitroreductase
MNRVNEIQILVIQNKSLLEELEENTLSYFEKNYKLRSAIYQAPTLIAVAVKKLTGAYEKGQYCSAACILENMIFAATEMGIGNVYLSGVTSAWNQNRELLTKAGIPEDYEAASAIAVGKTNQEFAERNLLEERIVTKWLV